MFELSNTHSCSLVVLEELTLVYSFSMPDVNSIGLGGGSRVRVEGSKVLVGPDSVGHYVSTDCIPVFIPVTDEVLAYPGRKSVRWQCSYCHRYCHARWGKEHWRFNSGSRYHSGHCRESSRCHEEVIGGKRVMNDTYFNDIPVTRVSWTG